VVIDTNVWISGLLMATGSPAQLVRQVIRHGRPVFSRDTFDEFAERLWRPKFDRYVSIDQRKAFLHDAAAIADWVEEPPSIAARSFCRDATDDKFIHTALAADSTFLVSGDSDLLVLTDIVLAMGVKIVTPADAVRLSEFSANP